MNCPAAVVAVVLLLLKVTSASAPRRPHSYSHLDKDWNALREMCDKYADVTGQQGAADRENCVRRCMSPSCYIWQYGEDALEDGEVDSVRGPRFRTCVLREIREARAAAAGMPLQPRRTPGYKRYFWG